MCFYCFTKAEAFFQAWRAAGFMVVGYLTFVKRYTSATRLRRVQDENAYLLAQGNPAPPAHVIGDVIEFAYSGNKLHPTQKPLSALTPIIESFCPRGRIVLDPFAGSGSTRVAARSIGQRYVGFEVDAGVHMIASRRLRAMDERLAQLLGVSLNCSDTTPAAEPEPTGTLATGEQGNQGHVREPVRGPGSPNAVPAAVELSLGLCKRLTGAA